VRIVAPDNAVGLFVQLCGLRLMERWAVKSYCVFLHIVQVTRMFTRRVVKMSQTVCRQLHIAHAIFRPVLLIC
jgi:hypothetical protein